MHVSNMHTYVLQENSFSEGIFSDIFKVITLFINPADVVKLKEVPKVECMCANS